MTRQVMAVAAYDSQLKWAMGLVKGFEANGWSWSLAVPADLRHALSAEQLAASGVTSYRELPWSELLAAAREVDCVVLSLQGPLVERFTDEQALWRLDNPGATKDAVSVTGWVGIIIEKVVAGYLDRANSDVIAVNSADNLREFTEAGRRLGIPSDNLFLSGLPLLPSQPKPMAEGPIRQVVFADQPTIPRESWDRAYLYQRLIDYALAHPETKVLLKPRHRPGESTFHVMEHHPEAVLKMLPAAPPNLEVTYESVTSLLPTTDLLLTVSSTAGLESIGAGVRTVFIGDLGVHEQYGNHVLMDSGLIATFEDVTAGRIPTPDPSWMADVFVDVDDLRPTQRIVKRVLELVELDVADRPSSVVAKERYLSGRLAIRRARAQMPDVARIPMGVGGNYNPAKAALRKRLAYLARAFLPRAAYERIRQSRQRRS